jgi:TonB dependent receptor
MVLPIGQEVAAPQRSQLGKVTWNYIGTQNFLNEFGLAANRPYSSQTTGEAGFPIFSCFFCEIGLGAVPSPQLFLAQSPQLSLQAIDTATLVKGRHQLKFGLDIRKNMTSRALTYQDSLTFAGGPAVPQAGMNGTIPSGGPEGMLADSALAWTRTGYPMHGSYNTNYAFFINDDFRLRPNLTLNIGLRYDHNSVLHDPSHQSANFDLASLSILPASEPLYQASWLDFAPRFGFNWDPFGKGKTSVRSGFGIFFLPISPGDVLNMATNLNSNLSVNVFQSLTCTPPLEITFPLQNPIPDCSPKPTASVQVYDRNAKDTHPNTIVSASSSRFPGERCLRSPTWVTTVFGCPPV